MAISAKTTLVAALAALVLPLPAYGAEIIEQPASVKRGEVVRMAWAGDAAEVALEGRSGLSWVMDASPVLVEQDGGLWVARWQPTYFTALGTYRLRAGELTSDEFSVGPCGCVLPDQVHARWREDRFLLSMTAEYAPAPSGGLHSLPKRVTTGRPVIRVMRDGRRIGSVRLRYERGKFRGVWRSRQGPRHSLVFKLVSLTDRYKNR